MIRNIFVALLFFFGPAMLMLVLRSLLFLIRYQLGRRRHRGAEGPVIIDVTPVDEKKSPSRFFWVVALLLGVVSAMLALYFLSHDSGEEIRRVYVPAHVNEQGEVVPGHWEPAP
ncbi:MAG: hypothetical protein D6703_04920 [Zetaproteobacteria bacterium]|nr:MAG: hypothetical protein D6703_04920 [Zetaproteobacteria bacterium]